MRLDERKNLKMSGIYLIRNKISGHCYVGQATNINTRVYQHIRAAFNDSCKDYDYPLHKAFRKYGLDNFELEILEECSPELFEEREMFWINQYNCRHEGYNQTDGGRQSIREIKLNKLLLAEIILLLQTSDLSIASIAKKYNLSECMIFRINSGAA